MNTLKQTLEICTKLHVDPAKIKIGKDESWKIGQQIRDEAIRLMLSKKESG
jgi:hypothetical protein